MELFHHFVGGHDSRICHALCMENRIPFLAGYFRRRDREEKDAPLRHLDTSPG